VSSTLHTIYKRLSRTFNATYRYDTFSCISGVKEHRQNIKTKAHGKHGPPPRRIQTGSGLRIRITSKI